MATMGILYYRIARGLGDELGDDEPQWSTFESESDSGYNTADEGPLLILWFL